MSSPSFSGLLTRSRRRSSSASASQRASCTDSPPFRHVHAHIPLLVLTRRDGRTNLLGVTDGARTRDLLSRATIRVTLLRDNLGTRRLTFTTRACSTLSLRSVVPVAAQVAHANALRSCTPTKATTSLVAGRRFASGD